MITTADGATLAITTWRADGPDWIVLAGAMGVPRGYYRHFAAFLHGRGYNVLTFDYRGVGDSAPERLRGCTARLWDWGAHDLPAVLDAARAERPRRLFVVGHSVGGQLLGLSTDQSITRVALVASQSGWLGHWPWPERLAVLPLWHAVIPVSTRLLGYFPGALMGMGVDLPAGVAAEWAAAARHPDYLWRIPEAAERFQAFKAPVLAIALADDRLYAPAEAVRALASRYGGPSEVLVLEPSEIGQRRVGHFGFFKPGLEAGWERLLAWLDHDDNH